MQKWTVDAASLVSFALVVAATAALPAPVAFSLAACEIAFAASAAVRFSAHSAPVDATAAAARHPTGSGAKPERTAAFRTVAAVLVPIFRYLSAIKSGSSSQQSFAFNGASQHLDAAAHNSGGNDSNARVESVASKLFDEKEGHLDLLHGGHLLAQWFSGLAGPHQLHLHHVTQLLAYLLLPASPAAPELAKNTAPADSNAADGATVGAQGTDEAACPRIRSWASRLMDLVHQHHHHPRPCAASSSTAAPSVPSTAAPAGPSPAKLLACTSDPLVASYRPLVFYLLTEAVAGATHLALTLMGFKASPTPNSTAIVYSWEPRGAAGSPAAGAAEQAARAEAGVEPPLVFLHGIGLGLTPYLRLLGRLVAASGGRRRVFAVQYKHVSMRLTANIPAPQEVATDVAAFLAAKGVSRMSLLAHSYGTLVASALTKLAAASPASPAVNRLTLVDPVCFAMFLPHLVRNAIYQQPVSQPGEQGDMGAGVAAPGGLQAGVARGSIGRSLLRSLIKGLVVAEFHCSVALRRRLDWAAVNLWPSELPPDTTVVLSGRDNMVPVREVQRILANRAALLGPSAPHPAVLFHPDLGHGGFLVDEHCQAQVLAAAADVPYDVARAAMDTAKTRRQGGSGQLPQDALDSVTAANGFALAAGHTVEAVEAVWSQPLGAELFRSDSVAADNGSATGAPAPAPSTVRDAPSAAPSTSAPPPWFTLPAGLQPPRALAAAILMVLCLAGLHEVIEDFDADIDGDWSKAVAASSASPLQALAALSLMALNGELERDPSAEGSRQQRGQVRPMALRLPRDVDVGVAPAGSGRPAVVCRSGPLSGVEAARRAAAASVLRTVATLTRRSGAANSGLRAVR